MQTLRVLCLAGRADRYSAIPGSVHLDLTALTAGSLATACAGAAPKIVIVPTAPLNKAVQAAAWAKQAGAAVVIDCHDSQVDGAFTAALRQLAGHADAVSVSSPGLASLVKATAGLDSRLVHDPCPGSHDRPEFAPSADRPLQLAWYGSPVDLLELGPLLNDLIPYAKHRLINLAIVADLPQPLADSVNRIREISGGRMEVTVSRWSDMAVQSAIAACDAVVLPAPPDEQSRIRGASRLMQALRAGRLVVAAPQPAYTAFDGGTIISSPVSAGLLRAEQDPAAAQARIATGQTLVEAAAGPAAVAEQWAAVFKAARETPAARVVAAPADLKFNLGCGDKILPGYINCDAVPSRGQGPAVDVQCNITKPLPFADSIASEILAVHVVEHIWRWEVVDVLREWCRILRPGGRMILECPNLLSAAMELIKNPAVAAGPGQEGQRSMWVFYGDPRWRDPLMNHCWGYTPQSLAAVMAEAGLVNLRQEPAQFKLREPRDMRVVGEKPLL